MTDDLTIVYVNPARKIRTEIRVLSREFASRGANVRVLLPSDDREQVTEVDDVTYVYYSPLYIPKIRYTIPRSTFYRQLRRQLSDADIVHIGSYFYPVCTIAAVLGRLSRTGVVTTIDSFPGVNWTSGNPIVDLVGRVYTATFGRLTFATSHRVVGLGEYLGPVMRRYMADRKMEFIPNGVDTDTFDLSDRSQADPETTHLLFVGRLDPVKDLPTLFAAVRTLSDGSGREYDLTIVGDGTNEGVYKERVRELGIEDRVRFVGYQEDVGQYYEESDLLVLPSLSEGQPTVLMEAQACGLPVVTTDVGGAAELVYTGETVPSRDSDALAAAIANWSEYDDEEATAARTYIVDRFSATEMARRYGELYADVLESRA